MPPHLVTIISVANQWLELQIKLILASSPLRTAYDQQQWKSYLLTMHLVKQPFYIQCLVQYSFSNSNCNWVVIFSGISCFSHFVYFWGTAGWHDRLQLLLPTQCTQNTNICESGGLTVFSQLMSLVDMISWPDLKVLLNYFLVMTNDVTSLSHFRLLVISW